MDMDMHTREAYLTGLRDAYLAGLREHGKPDLADLVERLNARTWSGEDAEPGARAPRYIVELHGVTVEVAVNADHTAVEIGVEDVPLARHPVVVSMGDAVLDDGEPRLREHYEDMMNTLDMAPTSAGFAEWRQNASRKVRLIAGIMTTIDDEALNPELTYVDVKAAAASQEQGK